MRSDLISINNSGLGFEEAADQSSRVAAFEGLGELETVQLQVLTEEMLSLARSITGEMNATFWIEMEKGLATLHMTTETVLDREKRAALIESSTSRKNEAAKTFLGKIREMFEKAMTSETSHDSPSMDVLQDLPHGIFEEPDWDGYERSILRKLADEIRIGIRGKTVEITVSKRFETK